MAIRGCRQKQSSRAKRSSRTEIHRPFPVGNGNEGRASPGCRRVGVLQVSLSLIPSGLPCGQPSVCLTPSLRPEGLRCALSLAAFPTGNAGQAGESRLTRKIDEECHVRNDRSAHLTRSL